MQINEVIKFKTQETVEPESTEIKKINIFNFLNDLYYDKKNILDEETEHLYKPFLINRWISGNLDTVLYAQEMNQRSELFPDQQYDYYFHSIPKRKRFSKWMKQDKDDKILLIMEYYNYNRSKAKDCLKLHSEEDYERIKKAMDRGGVSK